MLILISIQQDTASHLDWDPLWYMANKQRIISYPRVAVGLQGVVVSVNSTTQLSGVLSKKKVLHNKEIEGRLQVSDPVWGPKSLRAHVRPQQKQLLRRFPWDPQSLQHLKELL